jgi:hypothetical protein
MTLEAASQLAARMRHIADVPQSIVSVLALRRSLHLCNSILHQNVFRADFNNVFNVSRNRDHSALFGAIEPPFQTGLNIRDVLPEIGRRNVMCFQVVSIQVLVFFGNIILDERLWRKGSNIGPLG